MKIRSRFFYAILSFCIAVTPPAMAQVFPPGGFVIAGVPVSCGMTRTILTPMLSDAAMADGQGNILINTGTLFTLPPVLQLFVYAHECGHYTQGPSETGADCFAIRLGRDQGWFPPQAFQQLVFMFQNNPGDMTHPPGPARIQNIVNCYQS